MKLDFIPFQIPILPNPFFMGLKPALLGLATLLLIMAVRLLVLPPKRICRVARLGRLTWRRNQFCRGWLITGDTGSGKTRSGINQLLRRANCVSAPRPPPFLQSTPTRSVSK